MPKSRAQSHADRASRLQRYADEGLSNREITEREGFTDVVEAGKQMKPYRNKHPKTPTSYITYGLDCESSPMRYILAGYVNELINDHGAFEVGAMLGISSVHKYASTLVGKPVHDWTLSQLQRLAKAKGWTFGHLMKEITVPMRIMEPWAKNEDLKPYDYRHCKAVLGDTSAIQHPPRQPDDPGSGSA